VYEVAWQFKNLAYSSGLMFGRIIFTNAFRSLLSSNQWSYTNLFQLDRCQI